MTDSIPAEPVQPGAVRPPGVGGAGAGWHRLHPLTPVVRAGSRLFALILVLAGLAGVNRQQGAGQLVSDLVIIALALTGGFVSWLVTRWQLADGVLRVDTGLIRRDSRRFPLSQIQAIDVVQTGLARVLGLAELQLRVAGSDSARGGRLACLRLADAERLRAELLAFSAAARAGQAGPGSAGPVTAPAAGSAPTAGSPPRPAAAGQDARWPVDAQATERQLFCVRSGRLATAIVLSRPGAFAIAVIAAAAAVVAGTGQRAVTASFLPVALGIVASVWRWFNGEYATTVSAASDGLRLRSGLVQTASETIRPGRVQAVRLVEPLAWRAFGWCRLEVDVAGPRMRREDRSEGRRLRALVPVGSRAEAMQMLGELLDSRPVPESRPPRRVRWKAPMQYHFLAWGRDDHYVVASHGRITRTTTWIPLEKVQSIRWVQGPVQRRLHLASVRLDVAGRRVTGEIEDRADSEASQLLGQLPDLARQARESFGRS